MEKRFREIWCWRVLMGLTLAVVLAARTGSALTPSELPMLQPDAEIVVDVRAWPHFNWASFDQDKVVSFNGYQYGIFWDADRVLTLARRDLRSGDIDVLRFDAYVLADGLSERQQRNGHRNTVLGMSPGDGRLHLSWDHHNNDLNYTRSRAGFLTAPPETMSVDDFEPRQPLMEDAPQRVTYPRFFNDHQGNLYFFYRSGGSGSGDIALFEYDGSDGDWSVISLRLFGREGLYSAWNNSTSRNAYMHDLLFDEAGRLHITWVYREVAATWASNHDLHYAYSDDQGRTWKNNAGEVIADTRAGEQITIDSPGIVVYDIPVFSWLMNQCAMTLDSNNNPHVATFHMEEPFEPQDVQHDPPAEALDRLNYYHYWRDNTGEWRRSEPLPMAGRRRPMIAAAPDDTIVIYFSTNDGFVCHVAHADDAWSTWRSFRLGGPQWRVNDTTKPDRRRLREENILSFSADPRAQEPGSGFGFLDFDIRRIARFAAQQD